MESRRTAAEDSLLLADRKVSLSTRGTHIPIVPIVPKCPIVAGRPHCTNFAAKCKVADACGGGWAQVRTYKERFKMLMKLHMWMLDSV